MSPFIQLKGVSKSYSSKKGHRINALRHVNLSVEKGEICGVIGLSGAGKSTLLRCLATLEKPSLGQILFDGEEISSYSQKQLLKVRQEIGLIFQHFHLFSSRTVEENIAYPMEICEVPKEEQKRRIAHLLPLVGLEDKKGAYPAQLSGGQKQRVGIARALANNPKLLLCDEGTSALDPKTTVEILSLIQDLQKKLGFTVILITHEMEVVKQICHQVAVLDQGELVETGPLSEVFFSPSHPVTKQFVHKTIHEIPTNLLSGKGKVVHFHFKGESADAPIITQMAKKFGVDANILLGWIDSLQTITIGNLIVELTGESSMIEEALRFVQTKQIKVEELTLDRK